MAPPPERTEGIDDLCQEVAASAPDFLMVSTHDVAEAGLEGLEHNRRVVVPGLANRVGAVAGTHSPHAVLLRAMNRFYPVGR